MNISVYYALVTMTVVVGTITFLIYFFRIRNRKATECGHKTALKGKVSAFGETVTTKMKADENGNVKYCHDCLSDMAILCAWCERPIFIGNPITLYSPVKDDFAINDNAVVYKEDPLTLVGCGRTDCADTGADYAGRWMPPGKVERRPSLIEQSMADIQQGGDGVVSAAH